MRTCSVCGSVRSSMLIMASVFRSDPISAWNTSTIRSIPAARESRRNDVDFLVDIVTEARGFEYFGLLEELRQALAEALDHQVDVVTIGRTSAIGKPIAERIQQESVPL